MTTDQKTLSATHEAYCTSGTSPTTVHLLGPGSVGRELLRRLPDTPLRLVGITDTSGTLHSRDGLDPVRLAEHKSKRLPLAVIDGAESLPVDLAVDLVGADLLVDATPSGLHPAGSAVNRTERALRRGTAVALAAKDAVCVAGDRLLDRGGIGINAVLGGTGHALRTELADLRRHTRKIALVANASTTSVIETVENGGSIEDGIVAAQAAGVLEPDPELDLGGFDAATKLVAVARILWDHDESPARLAGHDLRELSAADLRARRARGLTTRLVGRATADGGFTLGYETVRRNSPLAVPGDRVAYTYTAADGRSRVHVGHGIGPARTAEALLFDIQDLAARREVRS